MPYVYREIYSIIIILIAPKNVLFQSSKKSNGAVYD
jgi:hypothetical protein